MKRVMLPLIGLLLTGCGIATPAALTPTALPTSTATDTPRPTPTDSPIPTATTIPALLATPDFAPTPGQIAYVVEDRGSYQISMINSDGSAPVALTYDGHDNLEPAWSPDGKRIAYSRWVGMQQEAIDSGSYVSAIDTVEIVVMGADGSNQTSLTRELSKQRLVARSPAWSPDGTKIAFQAAQVDQFSSLLAGWNLYVVNADGSGAPKKLTDWKPDAGHGCDNPAWLDSQHVVVFCILQMYGSALIYDINSSEAAYPFARHHAPFYGLSVDGVAAFSDRSTIATARGVDYTDVAPLVLDMPVLPSGFQPSLIGLAWSPTADWLAVRYTSGLAIIRADGSRQTTLISGLVEDDFSDALSWSPDGTQIVMDAWIDGNTELLLVSADGSGVIRLTHTDANEADPVWRP